MDEKKLKKRIATLSDEELIAETRKALEEVKRLFFLRD